MSSQVATLCAMGIFLAITLASLGLYIYLDDKSLSLDEGSWFRRNELSFRALRMAGITNLALMLLCVSPIFVLGYLEGWEMIPWIFLFYGFVWSVIALYVQIALTRAIWRLKRRLCA